MINPFGQTQISPDQLGALGQALMQRGYIPNSGIGGIGMQLLNTYLGQKAMNQANMPQITPTMPMMGNQGLNVPNINPMTPIIGTQSLDMDIPSKKQQNPG
jgi:hypothetical protein